VTHPHKFKRATLTPAAAVVALLLSTACGSNAQEALPITNSEDTEQQAAETTDAEVAIGDVSETPEDTPAPEAQDEPLYIGNDASFDYLIEVRDNRPKAWRIDDDALPTKQEVTGRVTPDMVNPERCTQLASLSEAGYLAQEGPLQYVTDSDINDEADDFIVVGQAPLGILQEVTETIPDCSTFSVSRQSPSVIDNTPTQDVMTYQLEAEEQPNGYLLIQFTGEGTVQITDTNYTCLSQGNRDCMYDKSIRGFRLFRQDGENLVGAGVTNTKTKGGSATRPMKANTFIEEAQAILELLEVQQ
jgi:hypothetical protein